MARRMLLLLTFATLVAVTVALATQGPSWPPKTRDGVTLFMCEGRASDVEHYARMSDDWKQAVDDCVARFARG